MTKWPILGVSDVWAAFPFSVSWFIKRCFYHHAKQDDPEALNLTTLFYRHGLCWSMLALSILVHSGALEFMSSGFARVSKASVEFIPSRRSANGRNSKSVLRWEMSDRRWPSLVILSWFACKDEEREQILPLVLEDLCFAVRQAAFGKHGGSCYSF